MIKKDDRIVIIGAGVSGLISALELEYAGYAPIIVEKSESVGGRVKTDIVDGYVLDHGFQVLLTAYPAAKKYLNFEDLKLKKFLPGAVIFQKGKGTKFGDPLRHSSFLFSTAISSAGSFGDKVKTFKLAQMLKQKNLSAIFLEKESTTMAYLQKFGFSEKMIQFFFRPFFAGIFLEPDLNTSSRMFEFVYKMFSTGHAAIPAKGMQSIPDQLKGKLRNTSFVLGKSVKSVSEHMINFNDGDSTQADRIIIATDPSPILGSSKQAPQQWKGCTTLYFTASESQIKAPLIGLIPAKESLANHFHYVTDVLGPKAKHLLSVTVVKPNELSDKLLIEQVKKDLNIHAGISGLKFLKLYHIPRSLPRIQNLKYSPDRNKLKISDHLFLAGDFLANGSLNAAMESGKAAAEVVIESLQS
jgi:protoporphyrinogen oxidase